MEILISKNIESLNKEIMFLSIRAASFERKTEFEGVFTVLDETRLEGEWV